MATAQCATTCCPLTPPPTLQWRGKSATLLLVAHGHQRTSRKFGKEITSNDVRIVTFEATNVDGGAMESSRPTFAFTAVVLPPLVGCAEKANVFFIHGANVSEQDARAWAAEMFKRLWQAGANMEVHPIAWESGIGPSYNYQVNVSNAFVTASRLAPYVNSIPGRRVVIAHSLGTMVATAAPWRAAELHVRDVRKAHGALALGWKLHALDLFEGVRTRHLAEGISSPPTCGR